MNCCLEAIPIHDELSTSTTAATGYSESQYKHLHYNARWVLPYPEALSVAVCVALARICRQLLIDFLQECRVVQRYLSACKVWSFSLALVQPSYELVGFCCMHARVRAGKIPGTCYVGRMGRHCGLQREERRGAGCTGRSATICVDLGRSI